INTILTHITRKQAAYIISKIPTYFQLIEEGKILRIKLQKKNERINNFKKQRENKAIKEHEEVLLKGIFDEEIKPLAAGKKKLKEVKNMKNNRNTYKHEMKKVNGLEENVFRLEFDDEEKFMTRIINNNHQKIADILTKVQERNNFPFKVRMMALVLLYEKQTEKYYNKLIVCNFKTLNNINNLNQVLLSFENDISDEILKLNNSQFILDKILAVYVTAIQYQQQGVGSYIELEKTLADKQCCINIQNKDDSCSLYCFMYFYYTQVLNKTFKDYNRVNNYKFTYEKGILDIQQINKDIINKQVEIGDIQFPCNLQDIKKIAKGFGFTFSLFEYQSVKENESIKIVPRVIENQRQITGIPHIDLLRVQKEQEDKINSHLVVIKNFQALMYDQCKRTKWYCRNCMCHILRKIKRKEVQLIRI
ncbi:hypothetical protein ABPG72_018897, partial [Tetrahymena utriculariae]